MSKGLGKVERIVLESLERDTDHKASVMTIAWQAHNGLDCFECTKDDPQPEKPPYSVYQATCRAVRGLEKKGLVRGEQGYGSGGNPWGRDKNGQHRGGSMVIKCVSLISV